MMENQNTHSFARSRQPLIGISLGEGEDVIVRYFFDEEEADAANSEHLIRDVLAVAGAWSDLGWNKMEKELHRIRHETHSTLPFPPL